MGLIMKILVVEDNPVAQKVLIKIIQKAGYKVLSALDGLQALNMIEKDNDIRIVLTDWMMPEIDGLTMCRKIREAQYDYYIYLILLTAKDSKEDAVKGLEAGADDYIIKNSDSEGLKARLRVGERIIRLEDQYKKANIQLFHSEKMASIGQLAAGVAHEINNPTGFISSNLKTLTDYQGDIKGILLQYRSLMAELSDLAAKNKLPSSIASQLVRITDLEEDADIDFILDDIMDLIGDCQEGSDRIKKIVIDLKDFAHPGEEKKQLANINEGIESTLNVINNELKYKTTLKKEYGELPLVMCYPQKLNQVFMNLFINASHAIDEHGGISIITQADNEFVKIIISDTGCGIPLDLVSRIFDPFFTTKEVGKGTGLGLNIAFNIIRQHDGTINVESEVGKGTSFIINLPVK